MTIGLICRIALNNVVICFNNERHPICYEEVANLLRTRYGLVVYVADLLVTQRGSLRQVSDLLRGSYCTGKLV